MPIKRFLIQGIVQGVGFRYFTCRTAHSLKSNIVEFRAY